MHKKAFEFKANVLLFENQSLFDEQLEIHRMTVKHLDLKEELYSIDEKKLASDFERISNSGENTRKQLRNLLYLTNKTYEAKGVDIESWLSDSK